MNVYVRIGKERSKPTTTSFYIDDTEETRITSGKSTKIRTPLLLNESPQHYRCTWLAKMVFTAAKSVYWTGYRHGQPRNRGSIPCKKYSITSRPSLGSTKPPIRWMLGEKLTTLSRAKVKEWMEPYLHFPMSSRTAHGQPYFINTNKYTAGRK